MSKREMAERIVALEREVEELKARGPETHLHYHYPPTQYVYPKPTTWWPYTNPWGTYTISSSGGMTGSSTSFPQPLGTNGGN